MTSIDHRIQGSSSRHAQTGRGWLWRIQAQVEGRGCLTRRAPCRTFEGASTLPRRRTKNVPSQAARQANCFGPCSSRADKPGFSNPKSFGRENGWRAQAPPELLSESTWAVVWVILQPRPLLKSKN